MGVTRRIIFPALRLLVWTVIAVALVRIAFDGADLDRTSDALAPTGAVQEPTVEATTGTITNVVTVQAAVTADPAVGVRATLAGTVSKVLAADGAAVQPGTPLLEIRQETPQDPLVKTDPVTGEQTTTERKPKVTVEVVKAPVAGTLAMPTLKDQVVAVGDEVATVSPGTLSVSGTLTPDQQYRLIGAPTTARVTLNGGPAPFECTGLRIGAPATTTGTPPDDGAAGSTSGTLSCAIPGGVTAFVGLGASLEVTNGEAKDAVVVPITAVQGSVQNGNVWVVAEPGDEPEQRAVTLGLTDGRTVQVTEGLALGDTVLQFIPVPGGASGEVDCGDPAQYDPAVCGG